MLKTASALVIVALGQFNYLYKNKDILPPKTGQTFIDKPRGLPEFKGAKRTTKPLLVSKKSLKKTPTAQFFTAKNHFTSTNETSRQTFISPVEFIAVAKTKDAADAMCCMMMSA